MPEAPSSSLSAFSRRRFLTHTGAAAASLLLLTACPDPEPPVTPTPTISFTGGDEGVLSYFYLLTRYSAEFYTAVLTTPPADLSAAELALLRDISRHLLIHRELLSLAASDNSITLNNGVREVSFAYTPTYTLSTRAGVLAAAQAIGDLVVAAHCGAAKLLTSVYLLRLVTKMTAVRARHAAAIRDLRLAGSFAATDVVPTTGAEAGLNQALTPTEVLTELGKLTSPIVLAAGSLPTS